MPAPARKSAKELELVLPATSANLGPAFDAAALALDLHLKIRARPAAAFSVRACGRDAEVCGRREEHLIIRTYQEVLRGEGKAVGPLWLRMANEIPIGKGCGSSAAARLAGIALAVHFGGLDWDDTRIIWEASRREGHPDNAAACWLGGLAIARMSGGAEAGGPGLQTARVQPKIAWPLLLAVPPKALPTEEARRVLPAQYSRADAVANVQNSLLLLVALLQGRGELLRCALQDRIHQPYRGLLCPLLPALAGLAGTRGVLGAALSGAGPSVLLFLDPGVPPKQTRQRVQTRLQADHLTAELIPTSVAESGARDGRAWLASRRRPAPPRPAGC